MSELASAPTASGQAFDQTAFDAASIGRFARFVAARSGRELTDFASLWRFSVDHPEEFWAGIWDYFDIRASRRYDRVLGATTMPGAEWFRGARLNYVDQVLRHADRPGTAVVSIAEDGSRVQTSWAQLARDVAGFAGTLRSLGVRPGDRVVGYLTNAVEPIVAFLGTAAVGAVWAGLGPDYGSEAAADRLAQLEPSVLVAVTGYQFNGRVFDRREEVVSLARRLGGELPVVVVERCGLALDTEALPGRALSWAEAVAPDVPLVTEQVAADHPLWVLFSSGTTGVPKGIVHGHAGVLVAQLCGLGLQFGAEAGGTFFWYTSTNWMMWNLVVSALLTGATTVAYEGSPGYPSMDRLWRLVAEERVTTFGTSPGHLQLSAGAGLRPGAEHDLSALRLIGVTGAPVPPAHYRWVADQVRADLPLVSTSGGTDVVGAFINWAPGLPIYPGEMPGPALGVAVEAFDPEGRPVVDEVGELVVTRPMPNMPVAFWNDPDGSRYRAAYFEVYPGIWRHGDWLTHTSRGTYVIHGRSDSTLNRGGVRIGSADLYRVVEAMPQVVEALVLGVELPDGDYWMPMFLVLADGVELDGTLREELRAQLRSKGSPRHVPDDFYAVAAIPHTKTGKKLEVPLKRILQGADPADVVSPGAVDRPELIDWYVELAHAGPR
ncbi:acetoacetate--CoA ligase [Nocardioides sp.]|uniref:acetoacetate--CoA ligase n=1 Tax=Nocardioides sp. TaxID=35761 RepID=UPI0039E6034F